MFKNLPLSPKPVQKGNVIILTFFLLAACMQYDESLAPNGDLNGNAPELLNGDPGSVAAMTKRTFTAHLLGVNERPNPVDSDAQGQAIFTISEDEMSIDFRLIVSDIENVVAAHIHCGTENSAGPPIANLFGGSLSGPVNGVLAEGTITGVIVRSAGACPPGGVQDFADLVELIRTGGAYVNVHSNPGFPGGEIRGQIQ